MASMNRGLNLPQIQHIVTEFEKESSMMDMKEEMMSDAVDDVMDEEEDEEEEGDKILKQVLDEIGVDLSQQVCFFRFFARFSVSVQQAPAHRCTYWHCNNVQNSCRSTTRGPRWSWRIFCWWSRESRG